MNSSFFFTGPGYTIISRISSIYVRSTLKKKKKKKKKNIGSMECKRDDVLLK